MQIRNKEEEKEGDVDGDNKAFYILEINIKIQKK